MTTDHHISPEVLLVRFDNQREVHHIASAGCIYLHTQDPKICSQCKDSPATWHMSNGTLACETCMLDEVLPSLIAGTAVMVRR